MFDQYDDLRASDSPEPERHLILVADSSPHTTGCRCNSIEKYDNFNTSSATQELLQVSVRSIAASINPPLGGDGQKNCDQELIINIYRDRGKKYKQRAISLSLVSPSEHSELVEIVKKVSD